MCIFSRLCFRSSPVCFGAGTPKSVLDVARMSHRLNCTSFFRVSVLLLLLLLLLRYITWERFSPPVAECDGIKQSACHCSPLNMAHAISTSCFTAALQCEAMLTAKEPTGRGQRPRAEQNAFPLPTRQILGTGRQEAVRLDPRQELDCRATAGHADYPGGRGLEHFCTQPCLRSTTLSSNTS